MTVIGFHASHEQIGPSALRDAVVHAEQAGFDAAMCSDHLAPWSSEQGESAFAFSWLGAALQATSRVPIGQFHAPGQRYHPVISAQAMATLAAMFPGRYTWAALGSGENLNEHVTGDRWPRKDVRMARLRECVDVMRALWRGEEVSHDGLVTVDRARLWTLPETAPLLIGGAVSVETARWAAGWADGLVTINQPHDKLREMVDAYRSAGGRGQLVIQVHVSYAQDEATATATAVEQWQSNCVPSDLAWDLELPRDFEAATRFVPEEEVRNNVLISSDTAQHAAWLQEYVDLGFSTVYVHHVGVEQDEFIDAFASKVLPQLRTEVSA
ncbi:MAG TPA: TIGR03885 family FMN-dependent LLM class oxidoreductase [Jiangellales bacterium]|nr:TIGR03885 family FMN-dependent LLM class oxidoreductase [Jiangellales bacterium]